MERAVLVYTTWPSIVEAERAGRAIVEKRLAAREYHRPRRGADAPERRRRRQAAPHVGLTASTMKAQVV